MPFTFTYDQRDAAPEAIREQLTERDGKFIFEAEPVSVVAETASKLKKLRGDLDLKATELGKFAKFKSLTEALADVDEEEIPHVLEAWQKRNEKDDGKGKPGEDSIKLKEQLERAHAKALKTREDENTALKTDLQKAQSELRDFKLWTPLREVFIKQSGDPGDWEVARLELSNQNRFGFDDDGKIVVLEDGYPSSVTPEKFFRDVYSEARPKFYKASGAAGSGAGNNTANGRGNGIDLSKMSPMERINAAREQQQKT